MKYEVFGLEMSDFGRFTVRPLTANGDHVPASRVLLRNGDSLARNGPMHARDG